MRKRISIITFALMILFTGITFVSAKTVSCGNVTGIPERIPELSSYAVTLIQVGVTVVLVIMGVIDLFKGVTSSKEDEAKKGRKLFVKRLVMAAIIFLSVVLVKAIFSVVAENDGANISSCIDCFVSNGCKK